LACVPHGVGSLPVVRSRLARIDSRRIFRPSVFHLWGGRPPTHATAPPPPFPHHSSRSVVRSPLTVPPYTGQIHMSVCCDTVTYCTRPAAAAHSHCYSVAIGFRASGGRRRPPQHNTRRVRWMSKNAVSPPWAGGCLADMQCRWMRVRGDSRGRATTNSHTPPPTPTHQGVQQRPVFRGQGRGAHSNVHHRQSRQWAVHVARIRTVLQALRTFELRRTDDGPSGGGGGGAAGGGAPCTGRRSRRRTRRRHRRRRRRAATSPSPRAAAAATTLVAPTATAGPRCAATVSIPSYKRPRSGPCEDPRLLRLETRQRGGLSPLMQLPSFPSTHAPEWRSDHLKIAPLGRRR